MKNRSKTEIISQVLGAAATNGEEGSNGATKTQIMYKSFLSFDQLNRYLSLLLENKLLNYDKKTAKYKVTDKGLKFLKLYDQIGDAIGVYG
jgi:predicted transcriptional regulator